VNLAASAIHLIPSLVLLVVLILAWRWEWIGATAFGAVGLLDIASLVPRSSIPVGTRVAWVAITAVSAFMVAALFLLGWLKHAEAHMRH
jgi:hypothetical protein